MLDGNQWRFTGCILAANQEAVMGDCHRNENRARIINSNQKKTSIRFSQPNIFAFFTTSISFYHQVWGLLYNNTLIWSRRLLSGDNSLVRNNTNNTGCIMLDGNQWRFTGCILVANQKAEMRNHHGNKTWS